MEATKTNGEDKRTNLDGWVNVLTNLGVRNRDPHGATTFDGSQLLAAGAGVEQLLEDLYRGDALARKIVDLPAREMTRRWIEIDGDAEGAIISALEEIDCRKQVTAWQRWARLHGGALLVILVNDGRPDSPEALAEPLAEDRIRKIRGFNVFSRWRVSQTELYTNPGDPKFNTPERYTITPINGQPFRIHESRILRADGVPTPERAQLQSLGWGDSVLTALWTALKNVGSADGYSIGILRDFVQGVMQIENLAQLIGAGRETDLITRLNLIDMSRSILNTIILDKTENYSRISASVAGLPELLDRHREALAAAAEMPVTLLFGRSPSGLSTDDRSGERNWYDKIAGEQEDRLRAPLERIIRLVQLSKEGPTGGKELEDWKLSFCPLYQVDEKEEAEIRKFHMETVTGFIAAGVLDPDEVAASMFGGVRYSSEIRIDPKTRMAPEEPEKVDEPEADDEPTGSAEVTGA